MSTHKPGSISSSGRTLAEEPAALIGHGGVCEGGGLVS
jgi:hypothetical protein